MLVRRPAAPNAPRHGRREGVSDGVAGLMVGMLSPFNRVFILALLPLFIPRGSPDLGDAATICLTVLAATVTAQTGATLVGAGALGLTLSRTRWMERGCAVSLIAFALVAVVSPIG
jgi:threonine/homoserine/homoserine lactone efflux protein